MDKQILIELLRADGSIIINKRLARKIGMYETIILSELLSRYKYFEDRDELTPDGYFYNTVEDLEKVVLLGKKGQKKHIDNLISLNLLTCSLRDYPQKRYFKINTEALLTILS